MTQLSNVCGTSPVNNQSVFFNGNYIHFDDHTLIHMEFQNLQPFVLKEVNLPTTRSMIMKQMPNWSLYTNWRRLLGLWSMGQKIFYLTTWTSYWWKNGTPEIFKLIISSGKALWKKLPPLIPTNLTNNTQACDTSIQISYADKAE